MRMELHDGISVLLRKKGLYSLERLILKLRLQYFGHLMQRANSLERPNSLEKALMLGNTEGRRRRG